MNAYIGGGAVFFGLDHFELIARRLPNGARSLAGGAAAAAAAAGVLLLPAAVRGGLALAHLAPNRRVRGSRSVHLPTVYSQAQHISSAAVKTAGQGGPTLRAQRAQNTQGGQLVEIRSTGALASGAQVGVVQHKHDAVRRGERGRRFRTHAGSAADRKSVV